MHCQEQLPLRRAGGIPWLVFLGVLLAALANAGEWRESPGYRCAPLNLPPTGKPGFALMPAPTTGILFSNELPDSLSLTKHVYQNGSGVAAGDIDGDGKCDLYFCAINGTNRLYRNLGNWHFQDITEQAGVGCAGLHSSGAALADLDGDGDLDLIVNTAGNGTLIFLNDGAGHFTRAPFTLNPSRAGESLALADTDGDGYLDLYVVNYRLSALMDLLNPGMFTFKTVDGHQTIATFNGRSVAEPDLADRFAIGPQGDFQENGEPDVLYRNLGGTNFAAVSFTNGNFLDEDGHPLRKLPLDWGLSAMFHDINGDGLPDLYVCNDFQSSDRFWINQGSNTFRLLPRLAQRRSSISSMSVDFADINRDGFDDFFVVDMMSRQHAQRMRLLSATYSPNQKPGYFEDRPQYEMNTLFLNRGDNTFAEIAQFSGLEATEWAWSCIFLDVDLDGWEDLLISNGMEHDGRDLDVLAQLKKLRAGRQPSDAEIRDVRRRFPRQTNGNLAFRNRGDLTFEEISKSWGFDWKGVSSGMALADLDNDGGLDVVVNTLNGPALVYRNTCSAARIAVRLKGKPPNTRGIGARITLGGALPRQTQEMICGGRYLSCDDAIRVFAAGTLTNSLSIVVDWRSGRRSMITNALPNYIYEVDELAAQEKQQPKEFTPDKPAPTRALFEDVSDKLAHTHHDDPFDDFNRQPLLPRKLSQLGPGVAWTDVDGDGRDDLIVGSGKGGPIGTFLNRWPQGFVHFEEPAFAKPLPRDQTGIVGWMAPTNQKHILVGSATYEQGSARGPGPAVEEYDLARKTVAAAVESNESSSGPLALADLAGTGDLALFVGGRVIPARYPEAASSRIFRYQSNQWLLDSNNSGVLEKIGLVSGAVFSDLDGKGYPDLILACEWGPIRIFQNSQGVLGPRDFPLTWPDQIPTNHLPFSISQLTGWWNGVSAGDFDGDGKMDFVVSNWGRNTKYQSLRAKPLSLYYGDLAGDGTLQMIEAYYDADLGKSVPERQLNVLAEGLPFLRGRFPSHAAFSTASVEEMLGDHVQGAKLLQVNCLESVVFLNRGDHFEAHFLPVEAQLSPAFGICIGDFDGDGNGDIFLAQNFFATAAETPRYDAGRGLCLKGDGHGAFHALSAQQSGIEVYGEQRGAAVCDFDEDGRLDLVVTENGAATRLFRNAGAKPGLRVRLEGTGSNRQAIGAVMRLKLGDRWGPAREVHGGSGYWSQDSAVQVLATPVAPTEIQVRWPGGKVTTNAIAAGTREITVGADGNIKAVQ
jgi:hypothetical protein